MGSVNCIFSKHVPLEKRCQWVGHPQIPFGAGDTTVLDASLAEAPSLATCEEGCVRRDAGPAGCVLRWLVFVTVRGNLNNLLHEKSQQLWAAALWFLMQTLQAIRNERKSADVLLVQLNHTWCLSRLNWGCALAGWPLASKNHPPQQWLPLRLSDCRGKGSSTGRAPTVGVVGTTDYLGASVA